MRRNRPAGREQRRPRRWPRWLRIPLYGLGGAVGLGLTALVAIELTMFRAGDRHDGVLAVTGATVLAGRDLEPLDDATVLIRDGVIVDVVESAGDLPAGTEVLDLAGATVMPGLVDLHVHLGAPAMEAGEEPGLLTLPRLVADYARFAPGQRRAFLEHGVTSVRTLGDDRDWISDVRRQLRDGDLEGPRLFVAGPVLTTRHGHPVATIHDGEVDEGSVRLPETPEAARRVVAELAGGDHPVDLIKVIQERGGPDRPLEPLPVDVLEAIVAEAGTHGLPVTGHWGSADDLRELLDVGVDGLEHLDSRDLLGSWPDGLLEEVAGGGVPVTATLSVTEAALPASVVGQLLDRVGELHDAGGRVVLGTDAGMPGVPFGESVHRELELLVEAGLSPHEALRAGTSDAARVLGDEHIGAIERSRAADLVAVGGDPIDDIGATRDVVLVLRDGRVVVDNREETGR